MQQQQQLLAAFINQQGGQGAFTLRPYGNVLDVTKKRDNDLYADAIKPFTEKFDGSPEKLSAFIDKVQEKAKHMAGRTWGLKVRGPNQERAHRLDNRRAARK